MQYLGNVTPGPVKTKVIELLYTWKHTIPSQSKVREVYDVLRAQKIIATDPKYIDDVRVVSMFDSVHTLSPGHSRASAKRSCATRQSHGNV